LPAGGDGGRGAQKRFYLIHELGARGHRQYRELLTTNVRQDGPE
jgi:hypothetical protein